MRVDRAVILAAGLGTRLKWLTHDRPKALMPVGDVPAIVHVIRRLAGSGVRDIAVNVHHHAGALMQFLGDGSRFGVRLCFSPETELLDSGGGVRTALEWLPGEGPVLVHNADVLCDVDVRALAAICPSDGCSIALVPNPAHHPKGDFVLRDGCVSQAEGTRFTFAGVSVWQPAALAGHAPNQAFPLTAPMRSLMQAGRCRGLLHRGDWFDIGRPADLMRARRAWSR